jgi:hypothetical protein
MKLRHASPKVDLVKSIDLLKRLRQTTLDLEDQRFRRAVVRGGMASAVLRLNVDGEDLLIPLSQGSNVIGKTGGSADVKLNAASLSRRHALITIGESAADCTVEDLGSTNGSSVMPPGEDMEQMEAGHVYPLPHGSALVSQPLAPSSSCEPAVVAAMCFEHYPGGSFWLRAVSPCGGYRFSATCVVLSLFRGLTSKWNRSSRGHTHGRPRRPRSPRKGGAATQCVTVRAVQLQTLEPWRSRGVRPESDTRTRTSTPRSWGCRCPTTPTFYGSRWRRS